MNVPDRASRGVWIERADIAARSAAVFQRNDLAAARTLPALVQRVSKLHGKPISITPTADEDWDTLTALWVDFPARARIFYRSTDTQLYRTHCILHELAHIIFQHPGCNILAGDENVERYKGTDGVVRGRLLEASVHHPPTPEIDGGDGRAVMEGEAEHLAHLLSGSLFRRRFPDDENVFG